MRFLVCSLALAFMSVGCAQNGDSMHKELVAIQQELGRMRAENAILTARIETLEAARLRQTPNETPPKSKASGDNDRPPLDVLRLAPTPETTSSSDKPRAKQPENLPSSEEVEADEPRPVIRSTGRGEVIAQTPRPSKSPAQPRPATTGSGTPR